MHGGADFTTLRPRREILRGYRDVVAEVYSPQAYESVLRNAGHYAHLYPFSRDLVRTIDARIAEMAAGR